jgi:hypothetical protein
VTIKDMFD